MRRATLILVLGAGVVLAVVSTRMSGLAPVPLIGDVLTGLVLVAAGAIVGRRVPASASGVLFALAGATWFLPAIVPAAVLLHRAPLLHGMLANPAGRAGSWRRRRVAVAITAIAYAIAIGASVFGVMTATVVLGLLFLVAALVCAADARRAGIPPVAAAACLLLGVVIVSSAASRVAGVGDPGTRLLVYEVSLMLAAALVSAPALMRHSGGFAARLVLDLGDGSVAGTLRDRLSHALGDPTLVLGFATRRLPGGYVDEAGIPIDVPEPGGTRTVTPLEAGGERIGVLIHEPAVLDDAQVLDTVMAATRLAVANASLQVSVRAISADVAASGSRLLRAGDAERRELETRIRLGPVRRVDAARTLLEGVAPRGEPQLAAYLGDLDRARAELLRFARGVHPAALADGGLPAALAELAGSAPVPVTVTMDVRRLQPALESALYFVAAEGMANALKHGAARHLSIDVRDVGGEVSLRVADDGTGEAAVGQSGGLRGLADRIEALGGVLVVENGRTGTTLRATVPIGLWESPAPRSVEVTA